MLWDNDRWSELERIRQDMDNLLTGRGHFFEDYTYPLINVYEDPDTIRVAAELAGLVKEDVDISFSADVLSLKGKYTIPEKYAGTAVVRKERSNGAFEKSVRIHSPVDVEKISAEFKDGMLTVTLPKKEEAKPRQISIKA